MIADLHDEKTKLKELVRLAISGEDVVITDGGKPVASIKALGSKIITHEARVEWLKKRRAIAREVAAGEPKDTTQEFWDWMRADRF